MLCVASPAFPFVASAFNVEVLDCRDVSGGCAVVEVDLLSVIILPASLPLSFANCLDMGLELSSASDDASEMILSSRFSNESSTS
jgi:hypothetical protein